MRKNKRWNPLTWLGSRLASVLIPAHIKRITLLVTAYHYLNKDDSNELKDESELTELNSELQLAKTDVKALILPGFLTRFIWKMTDRDVGDMSTQLPKWLKYGNEMEMAADLERLNRFVHSHPHNAK